MSLRSLSAAALLLLASSLAVAGQPVKAEKPKDAAPASVAATPAPHARAPTREEVRAEAVEAARHHRATLSESLDFLKN
jgi:hypothetical protein